ncbi:MAG: MaoC/PaaZ C-terminal domain-containing protein [Nitrosomonas sp.]|nr:hypothetical protein [Nitrosomonas sp.]
MLQETGHYTISKQQSDAFAKLSGDYNPLHVDAVYARRLQFGHPVIHGIHHLLSTWDAVNIAELQQGSPVQLQLSELVATFPNPVRAGQRIDYRCELFPEQRSAMISAVCEDQRILSLRLKFSTDDRAVPGAFLPTCPPKETPVHQDFPLTHDSGQCQLYLDQSLGKQLFPNLMRYVLPQQLAQIIACTRIVGMKCPGLNSIFAGIRLNFNADIAGSGGGEDEIRFSVTYRDERVKMLKIDVEGKSMKGMLDTFLRPAPVKQPSYAEVCATVTGSRFATQRALVVGGSRGVGEITAKLLSAGGADVIITYHQGLEEAENVTKEIIDGGGRCRAVSLDTNALSEESQILFGTQLPTHIYYFASPHISLNRTRIWNAALFNQFCQFYLDAFAGLVSLYAGHASQSGVSLTFFYPSTVFIEKPEKGFAEYAVAKGAGEALCRQLEVRYPGIQFFMPRLPRMSTDQTSSIIPIKCESVLDVMRGELNNVK